jgi:HlyD family secretion protein
MKKAITVIIIILVVAAGAYFAYFQYQKANAAVTTQFETVPVTRGDLTAIVGATGTVRANQTATVGWQISGKIGTISVSLDQVVTAGSVLAELDPQSLPQTLIQAEADLITAQNNLESVQNIEVARARAQVALADAQNSLETAQHRRDSKDYQRASEATIDAAQASYILTQDAVNQAETFYSYFQSLPENDVNRASAFSSLSAARQNRDRALAQLNYLLSVPDSLEIAQADANLALAQANLDAAQREWDRLKDGPDPNDVRVAEVRIAAIQSSLALKTLTAPINGTITAINSMLGDQVAPGVTSFRIDDFSRLVVDVLVAEVDINRVKVDQIARLTFDAITSRDYMGKVVEVARVGANSQQGVQFQVTIQLLDADEQVLPGMTAAVNIIVNQLNNVLLVPNQAIRSSNSNTVVYILKNGAPQQVVIQLGLASDTYSEVIGGDIAEGDTIILNPPSNTQPGGGFFGP